jgi:hypothetical protein
VQGEETILILARQFGAADEVMITWEHGREHLWDIESANSILLLKTTVTSGIALWRNGH